MRCYGRLLNISNLVHIIYEDVRKCRKCFFASKTTLQRYVTFDEVSYSMKSFSTTCRTPDFRTDNLGVTATSRVPLALQRKLCNVELKGLKGKAGRRTGNMDWTVVTSQSRKWQLKTNSERIKLAINEFLPATISICFHFCAS